MSKQKRFIRPRRDHVDTELGVKILDGQAVNHALPSSQYQNARQTDTYLCTLTYPFFPPTLRPHWDITLHRGSSHVETFLIPFPHHLPHVSTLGLTLTAVMPPLFH